MKKIIIIQIFLLILQTRLFAIGNDFLAHQRNIIPGGRPLLMGGAYTAISDDPAGLYFNPSGLVHGSNKNISISGNTYYANTLTYKEAVNGEDFSESSEGLFPNFIGGTFKTKSLSFGYSLLSSDVKNIDQNNRYENISTVANEANSFRRTHQENNTLILGGLGGAFKITRFWSLGASVFYYRRSIQASNHQLTQFNDGKTFIIDQKFTTLNGGLSIIWGLQYKNKNFTVGFSAKELIAISDKTKVNYDSISGNQTTAETAEIVTIASELKSFNELNPSTYRLGFAWLPKKYLTLSSDIIYHRGVISQYKDEGGTDLEDTLNYSLGSELTYKKLVIRNGIFTNNSMFPEPKKGEKNQVPHINYFGFSFGFAWKTRQGETSFGVSKQIAKGKGQILSEDENIQDVTGESTMYIWSTSYDFN